MTVIMKIIPSTKCNFKLKLVYKWLVCSYHEKELIKIQYLISLMIALYDYILLISA